MKNIGGGLLCSFDNRTFDPIVMPDGSIGVVVPCEPADTYLATCGDSVLATHPNGHSCRSLLERMRDQSADRAIAQFDYILSCGGTGQARDAFIIHLRKAQTPKQHD